MLEGRGRQHFDTQVVRQHVDEIQTQLRVVAYPRRRAGQRAGGRRVDHAARLRRLHAGGAHAHDHVALLDRQRRHRGQQHVCTQDCPAQYPCWKLDLRDSAPIAPNSVQGVFTLQKDYELSHGC